MTFYTKLSQTQLNSPHWGKFSGFFFYAYGVKKEIIGPFPTRDEAERNRQFGMSHRVKCGRVFQKEKPVRF